MVKTIRTAVEAYKSVDDFEKEELIKSYLPLCEEWYIVFPEGFQKMVDIREMLNSGVIGLVECAGEV